MVRSSGEEALEVAEEMRRLALRLEELAASSMTDRDVLDVAQASARAQAAATTGHTAVIAIVDARSAQTDDGLASPVPWLTHNTQVTRPHARRIVKRASLLRRAPLLARRLREGRLSPDQIDAIAHCWNDRVEDFLLALQEPIADLAESSTVDQFARDLRSLVEAADTNGAEPDPGYKDRGLSLTQDFDGRFSGNLTLSGTAGAKVVAIIDALAEQYRRQDLDGDVLRTPAQRRADALVALITSDVTLDVTIDLVLPADQIPGFDPESLAGKESTGTRHSRSPIDHDERSPHPARPGEDSIGPPDQQPWVAGPPGSGFLAPRWRAAIGLSGFGYSARVLHGQRRVTEAALLAFAADAAFRAVVVHPRNGSVLHYGRKARFASAAQRAALAIEAAGTCSFPGCDRPALYTDAHHVQEWNAGNGLTDQENLLPLCGADHDLIHDTGFSITKAPDHPAAGIGGATVTRPDGSIIDPRPGWSRPRTFRPPPPRTPRRVTGRDERRRRRPPPERICRSGAHHPRDSTAA